MHSPTIEQQARVEHDDLSLERRHRAALRLIHAGTEVDGELLLSLVVWPTPWLDEATAAALDREAS